MRVALLLHAPVLAARTRHAYSMRSRRGQASRRNLRIVSLLPPYARYASSGAVVPPASSYRGRWRAQSPPCAGGGARGPAPPARSFPAAQASHRGAVDSRIPGRDRSGVVCVVRFPISEGLCLNYTITDVCSEPAVTHDRARAAHLLRDLFNRSFSTSASSSAPRVPKMSRLSNESSCSSPARRPEDAGGFLSESG